MLMTNLTLGNTWVLKSKDDASGDGKRHGGNAAHCLLFSC